MSFFGAMIMERLKHKFMSDSGNEEPKDLTEARKQLLQAQTTELNAKNAQIAYDFQHKFIQNQLQETGMQSANEIAAQKSYIGDKTLEDQIAQSTSRTKESAASANKAEEDVASARLDNARKQLGLADSFSTAMASKEQLGPQDVANDTNDFLDMVGVKPEVRDASYRIFSQQIAQQYAQKHDEYNQAKSLNGELVKAKKDADLSRLLNYAQKDSTDPGRQVELAAGILGGIDPDVVAKAKELVNIPTKEPMVSPREDARTKSLNENIAASESSMSAILEKAGVTDPNQLKPGPKKNYDAKRATYDSLNDALDRYQKGATSRQIPKKAAGVETQNKKEGKTTADLPSAIMNLNDDEIKQAAAVWGFTPAEIMAEIAKRKKGAK